MLKQCEYLLACTQTLQSSHTNKGLNPSLSSNVLDPNGLGLSVLAAKHISGIMGSVLCGMVRFFEDFLALFGESLLVSGNC